MQISINKALLKPFRPVLGALSLVLLACQAPATLPAPDAPLSISVQTPVQPSAKQAEGAIPQNATNASSASATVPAGIKTNVLPSDLAKILPAQVASLKLLSERSSFTAVGQQAKLSLSLLDAEGKEVTAPAALSWSSSHPERIAVASTGPLSANLSALSAAGPAEITVQLDGTDLKASLKIAVATSVSESSSSGSSGGGGVYAQRYNAAGLPLGSEFRVNSTTSDDQFNPTVAMNSHGNFVVAWTSVGQDGSNSGVYAQRYSADGTAQGGEFQVNVTTAGEQSNPSIDMDDSGRFVIAYNCQNLDGNDYAVEGCAL